MSILKAIILGLLQGFTEFLPVSSSGHLEIAKYILNVDIKNDLMYTFILHIATVLSIVFVFFNDLKNLFLSLIIKRDKNNFQYLIKLIVSAIPAAFVGLMFEDFIEQFFEGKIFFVSIMLILTAILLFIANNLSKKSFRNITYIDSFIVGIAQAIAILPGISRSGATISAGLILKIKREEISKFAFLMLLIPVLGKVMLDAGNGKLTSMDIDIIPLAFSFLSAFISGIIACKIVINFVKKSKLIYFSIYCLFISILTLVIYFLR